MDLRIDDSKTKGFTKLSSSLLQHSYWITNPKLFWICKYFIRVYLIYIQDIFSMVLLLKKKVDIHRFAIKISRVLEITICLPNRISIVKIDLFIILNKIIFGLAKSFTMYYYK